MKFARFFILFILLTVSIKAVWAQDVLTFLDGALSFQRPPGVTLWEERPSIDDPNHRNFWWGRIRLTVNIHDEETLKVRFRTIMNRAVHDLAYNNELLTRDDLLSLFDAKTEFILLPFEPRVEVRKSYKRLMHDGITIGESFFHANALNLEARGNFGYLTSIIVENKIVIISLSLFTGEENNPLRQLDGYTVTRGGALNWVDDKAQSAFYEHISSDRYIEMPLILQQLREAYDFILQTMEIRQDGSDKRMGIEIIRPPLEFQRTHITARAMRLQERVDEQAPTILNLPEGTDVQVIMVSEFMGTRIGVPFPWVIVTTREGIVGWVFSGFLDSVEDLVEDIAIADGVIDANNELLAHNAGDVDESESVRTWLWLLLLIPLVFIVVFFVRKIGN